MLQQNFQFEMLCVTPFYYGVMGAACPRPLLQHVYIFTALVSLTFALSNLHPGPLIFLHLYRLWHVVVVDQNICVVVVKTSVTN